MKQLLFITCLCISINTFSQDSLVNLCSKKLCDYIHASSLQSEDPFLGYFSDLVKANQSLVVTGAISLYHDSSGKRNDEFVDLVKRKTIIRLIETCDSFYVIFDSLRYAEMRQLSHDELMKEVRKTARTPTGSFYTRRALYYFALGELDTALTDLDMALALGSNPRTYFYKAWIMEAKGDYKSALALYNRSLAESGEEDDAMYIALIKRKMKEEGPVLAKKIEVPETGFKTQKGKKKNKKTEGFAEAQP
ncbi:MAG: tetratricopeptide repeat protein [Chitinophagaceae bacterium]|nr:tetratricopeptide repeat protein [Chitinophagaceae bacterium]